MAGLDKSINWAQRTEEPDTPPAGRVYMYYENNELRAKFPNGTITVFGEGITQEQVIDTMGTVIVGGSGIDKVFDDAGDTITLSIDTATFALINNAIQPGDLATVATTGDYADLINVPADIDNIVTLDGSFKNTADVTQAADGINITVLTWANATIAAAPAGDYVITANCYITRSGGGNLQPRLVVTSNAVTTTYFTGTFVNNASLYTTRMIHTHTSGDLVVEARTSTSNNSTSITAGWRILTIEKVG